MTLAIALALGLAVGVAIRVMMVRNGSAARAQEKRRAYRLRKELDRQTHEDIGRYD